MRRVLVGVCLLLLTGCGASAAADREAGNGGEPDAFADLANVTIYRAPNWVPNLALVCAGPYAFAMTLNSENGGRGQLQRQADLDGPYCGRVPG